MSNKFHFDAKLCQSSCQAVTKLKTLSPPVISTPVTKFWVGIFDLVNNIIQLISEKQGIDRTQFSIPFPFWLWLGKGGIAKVELSILQLPILPRRWNTSGLKVNQLTNKLRKIIMATYPWCVFKWLGGWRASPISVSEMCALHISVNAKSHYASDVSIKSFQDIDFGKAVIVWVKLRKDQSKNSHMLSRGVSP